MVYEYSEVSVYIRCPDTPGLLDAIAALIVREGMVRTERPARALHGAPALLNNRWAVHLLAGRDGWHLLRATPWSLWCDHAEGAAEARFVELARRLSARGFLIALMDCHPYAHGEVLIEADGKGQSAATGNWTERPWPGDGSAPATSQFFGRDLQPGRIAPRSRALQTLWQESLDLWKDRAGNPEYDDCRGDSESEVFCHYLMRRLLGRRSCDVGDPDSWPAEASHTLHFEWPAGDRPEPPEPEPPPDPDVRYADGSRVERGDAVLLDGGLGSGRVRDFLYSGDSVAMVLVDDGQPGQCCMRVGDVGRGLQLVERNTADHARAADRFLADRAAAGDAASIFARAVRLARSAQSAEDGRCGYELLTRAADEGHAEAQYLAGTLGKDEAQSARYWRMAAEQGHAGAGFALGLACFEGRGVPQDVRAAERWFGVAGSQGHLAAQYNLAHISAGGAVFTRDANPGAEWFQAHADAGDAPAQWIMGLCLELGLAGASPDARQAVRYYRMGAAQGFGPALCNLADKYERGTGVAQNLGEAMRLYREAALANVPAAFYSVGLMYRDGRGVPRDDAQAAAWLSRAADFGWPGARAALRDLPDGEFRQVQHLLDQADSPAGPDGVTPGAVQLFDEALAVYDPEDPEALALAFALLRHAAGQGHPHATFQLGFMHLRGLATEPDAARALALWRRAAELGDAEAQVALGEWFENGTGGRQDHAEARRWYEMAAAQGRTDAQFKLGLRDSPAPGAAPTPKDRPWWRLR